jgi:hypothetical protein
LFAISNTHNVSTLFTPWSISSNRDAIQATTPTKIICWRSRDVVVVVVVVDVVSDDHWQWWNKNDNVGVFNHVIISMATATDAQVTIPITTRVIIFIIIIHYYRNRWRPYLNHLYHRSVFTELFH